MDADYLVFWNQSHQGPSRNATVVRLSYPPHEMPHGSILEGLVLQDLEPVYGRGVKIYGIVELASSMWSPGATRELALGDGRVGTLECTAHGWATHI